jgi:hypothetical protein
VKISPKEGKNNKPFHPLVRPDIWNWTNKITQDLIPEQQRIRHMVEVKSCWGGVYEPTIGKEDGSTSQTCPCKANKIDKSN